MNAAQSGYFDLGIVAFDSGSFKEFVDVLGKQTFDVTEYSDTSLDGVVTAEEDGVLYTSIPYEEGWKVSVNDLDVQVIDYQDGMMAFPVFSGTNNIRMTYKPRGFVTGAIVSGGAVIILLIISWLDWGGMRKSRVQEEDIMVKEDQSEK